MSVATIPLPARVKKARRPRAEARPCALPFPISGQGEQLLVGLRNWETYLLLDEVLSGRGFRVPYHRRKIELMSISYRHESIKSLLGSLIEAFCDLRDLDYFQWDRTTQRVETSMGGEPDVSYNFGSALAEMPQLAVEVALSSGGIEKLSFWAEKRVPEVWNWQSGRLHAFGFRDGSYEPQTESRCLPGFPFPLAEELLGTESPLKAVREFRRRLTQGA